MKDEVLIRRRVWLTTTTRLWGIKNQLSSFPHPSLLLSLSLSPLAEPVLWKCHRWTLSHPNSNVLGCSSVILTTKALPASTSGGYGGMFYKAGLFSPPFQQIFRNSLHSQVCPKADCSASCTFLNEMKTKSVSVWLLEFVGLVSWCLDHNMHHTLSFHLVWSRPPLTVESEISVGYIWLKQTMIIKLNL